MKKLCALSLLGITLSGCVPALLVGAMGGATVGGAIIYDKRAPSQITKDREISQTAHNTLDADPLLKGHIHINVATFNGVVLLVGQAETPELRARAYSDVQQIRDIRRIYNEISVDPRSGLADRSTDSWITTKVISAIMGQKGLNTSQIKVITERNVVYLMGIVTAQQANLAAEVARRVSGVSRVVKVFEITQ